MTFSSRVDFRQAGHAAVELVADHLATIADGPVWRPVAPADRDALLDQPLPENGRPLAELLETIRTRILPYPMGNGHPRFFGWVNSPPDPAGIIAALIAAGFNPSCASGDQQSSAHLERAVLTWLAELVGYPHRFGGGLLTSGASMATIVALGAARNTAAARLGHDIRTAGLHGLPPLTLYVSEEGHSCLHKAAQVLGIGTDQIRIIPTDQVGRMDPAALAATLAADRAAGAVPFCVAASAGTVNTGLIDPLDAIADVCAREDVWFHIDGAYGALGVLDPTISARYAGMEKADSLALDPHKWLSVPVDCGCVLVRDGATLRDTYSLVPPYLRPDSGGEPGDRDADLAGLGWYAEYGIEQTRPFRALKVWAVLANAGRAGVQAHIEHCTGLARKLGDLITAADDLELVAPVETSITAFRYRPTGAAPGAALDQINRALPPAVQKRGHTFLTGTVYRGHEILRACFLHPDTSENDLHALLSEVREAGRQLTPRP